MSATVENATVVAYKDRVVTTLVVFSVIWAVIGMAAGVYVAAELVWPTLDFGTSRKISKGKHRSAELTAGSLDHGPCNITFADLSACAKADRGF